MTRQERQRRRRVEALARDAFDRGLAAATPAAALPWLERAHRFAPADTSTAFALASARLATGDAAGALVLFDALTLRHGGRESWAGLAAAALADGDHDRARAAVATLEAGYALDDSAAAVVRAVRAACGGLAAGPPDPRTLARVEGFVARSGTGLTGWAWHPADPDRDPTLHLLTPDGTPIRSIVAHRAAPAAGHAPLARRRAFRLTRVPAGPFRIVDADGRDLWGSPLSPRALRPGPSPAGAPRPPPEPGAAVIVPVHGGGAAVLDCLDSVLATLRPHDRLIVVDDASPDPALMEAIAALPGAGRLTLIPSDPADPGRNRGYPAAANAGLRAAAGRDAILLNSDTQVFPGWIEGLAAAASSAADIGTATAIGNEAGRFSFPDPDGVPMPDPETGAALARLAAEASGDIVIEAPTGHGFCLYIRADCLAATGLLREDVFAQGYGEENDFTERARAQGFRHMIATGVYVAHAGAGSFGTAKAALMARNMALLHALHPGYHARIAAFLAADPLRSARARFDAARWRAAARHGAVLLVTHDVGGGTERLVATRVARARAEGLRAVRLVGDRGTVRLADEAGDYPNLRFRLPRDMPALRDLLAGDRPVRAEVHHLLGHHHAVFGLIAALGVPYEVWIHDYAWLCPRVALVNADERYCGEPPPEVCIACIAQGGRRDGQVVAPAALRARSARDIGQAARVVTPAADVARRLRRHFPGVAPVIEPWALDAPAPRAGVWNARRRVAVVGAIGPEKGYAVLLACAQDAAARRLPLDFVLIGYAVEDAPLLAAGVFVTGPFQAHEVPAIIRAERPSLAFLPSIFPETWCFALSDAWAAGLDVAVFDIGAPAERVRASGRGWVLPLGLPAPRINAALLNIQPLAISPPGKPPQVAQGQGAHG